MLLDILETEDSYIDVDTIIVKMNFHFILFLKFHFNILSLHLSRIVSI